MRQPPAAAAGRRSRDDGAPRRSARRGDREGQDLRRTQPVGRGHAPGAAAGAVPRHLTRGLAQGGLRLRRGHQGGRLLDAQRQDQAAHPDAAQLQEPRQRGHLGLRDGALPAAPGRGGRRVRPHRDLRHAADRRGRPRRRRALGRQGPRQGRRAAGKLRAGHRHQGAGDGARRGLLGAHHRRRDQGVRPRRGPRAAGVGARRQGGLEGSQAARPRDPHDRSVAAEARRQVRADRRHLAVPDEGREDRRGPRQDRLRHRPRVRRRHHLRPRPAAAVQDAPARQGHPRGRRTRRLGREGAAGRRLLVDAEARRCRAR